MVRRRGPRGRSPAPAIDTLRDQTGQLFSLASLRGRSVAIVFFDSHCHQECPLEGRALAAAESSLPAAQRPVLVAVSVNPLDTRASAASAVRAWGLAGEAPWHWLMGTRGQLAPVWAAYHIYVSPHLRSTVTSPTPRRCIWSTGAATSGPPTCGRSRPVRDDGPSNAVPRSEYLAVAVAELVEALPASAALPARRAAAWRDYVILTKPRIMSLLVLTAACAMVAGARGAPGALPLLALVVGGALACGGASALNHVLDRDIDRLMGPRTASRPVAAGRISPAPAVALRACAVDGVVRAHGFGTEPARGRPGCQWRHVLRARVHALAEADHSPEHRYRWRGRRGPAARWLGGRARPAGIGSAVPVSDRAGVDAAALLGTGAAHSAKL